MGLVVGSLPKPKSRETLEVEKSVRDFYSNDETSQISNVHAVVPIEKGGSETTPVRFMLHTIREAYDESKNLSINMTSVNKNSAAYQKANFPERYALYMERSKLRCAKNRKIKKENPKEYALYRERDNLRCAKARKILKENPKEYALKLERDNLRKRNLYNNTKANNPKKHAEQLKKKNLRQAKSNKKKKAILNANPELLDQFMKSQNEKTKIYYGKRKELFAADPKKHAEFKKYNRERASWRKECLKKRNVSIRPLKNIEEIGETEFEKYWNALPEDDEKKKALFAGFAKRLGLVVGTLSMRKSKKILEKEKLVRDYYINDNISQISTNIVLKDGTYVRYMLYTIHEAYDKFNVDFPDQKISHKKFAKLRPHFVKLKSQIPHRTCLCSIHENMGFALKALALADPTFKDVAIGCNMHSNFICDGDKKVCFSKKCHLCKQSPAFFEKFEENEVNASKSVTWEQWVIDRTAFEHVKRVKKTGTVPDLLKHIEEMKVKFLLHVLVKRNQAACLESYRKQAKSEDATTAVLQVDWSKNYQCFCQNEIHDVYWDRDKKEVSIFTAMMWHRGKQSMAGALNSKDKTKKTIIPCLDKLFNEEIPTTATTVHIFSDNALGQFKNKYTMALLPALQKKHQKKIIWHYLAAQHGKSAADGIGGGLKLAASNRSKGVALKLIVDESEIDKINAEIGLEDICSNNPLQIKNFLKYHCFKVGFKGVEYQKLSSFDQEEQDDVLMDDEEEDDILIGEDQEEQYDVLMDDEEDDNFEGVLVNFHQATQLGHWKYQC
ncbi:CLUMA_CG016580, isoform A [Clunio marinus]|uniref:CLUMA_CG016580, isoform A n=1 Tax=Clunio marinus TaxID=568069 RepID=A0A1J1IUF5_9DIPT|nr:CLUMA_CG016580, isoform A [Clunio marinus]